MKIAYFDCFAGASGDMILGSLMDAGLSLETLKTEIAKLGLDAYDLQAAKVMKKGLGGTQARVILEQDHGQPPHRSLSHIKEIIMESRLDASVKQKSIEIFVRLAQAEARVHHSPIEAVHFHEVGAMDAIIDVVGAVAGLNALGIQKVFCSPLHVGSGTITCAHGTLPVPAPATAELIKGRPVYSTGVRGELLTPTGAAILTTLSSGFGPMPAMTVRQTGYGAGTSDPDIPNLLRVMIGDAQDEIGGYESEQAALIETTIDDMNPQIYDYIFQKILDMGAMDVFLTPVQMKKNRPGTLLTVICPLDKVPGVSNFLLRETSSIGLRWRVEHRIKAPRTIQTLHTRYGPVRIKIAETHGIPINLSPEYEDCKRISLERDIPLKQVLDQVKADALREWV